MVSIYCVEKAIQNQNVVGPGQGSRFFQRMTKGIPGDEVAYGTVDKAHVRGTVLVYTMSPEFFLFLGASSRIKTQITFFSMPVQSTLP